MTKCVRKSIVIHSLVCLKRNLKLLHQFSCLEKRECRWENKNLRKQKCLLIEILSLLNDLKENNLQLFFKKPLWLKTNHPPITDHLPTDPPKTDPILTDPIDNILFKRLASRRISILQNTNIAGKLQIYTLVYHLFDE